MTPLLLRLYDHLHRHPRQRWTLLVLLLLFMGGSVATLHFKEDITDFLPLSPQHRRAMSAYQQLNASDRILVVAEGDDPDAMAAALDRFAEAFARADTSRMVRRVTASIDLDSLMAAGDFVMHNIPYFLTEADYRRMDSLLATPNAVRTQLEADRQMLMLPTAGMAQRHLPTDPLQLFSPIVEELHNFRAAMHYDLRDGHIFSADHRLALLIITSRFGGNETAGNSRLVALVETVMQRLNTEMSTAAASGSPKVVLRQIGAPTIAVGNADRIKADSLLTIGIAVVLILALLVYTLRRRRHILLVFAATGFGWLAALTVLSWVNGSVSLIVMGISSVVVGIAVNYPLHFLTHLRHSGAARRNLRELVAPLLIGNVTTVGAFAALLPLQAPALRDLGLFAAAMLVGTIVFVILFLPHLVGKETTGTTMTKAETLTPSPRIGRWKRTFLLAFLPLTLWLGYSSLSTVFDPELQHLNYLTAEQQSLLRRLAPMTIPDSTRETLYLTSSGATLDEALQHDARLTHRLDRLAPSGTLRPMSNAERFLPSQAEQRRRIDRWQAWVDSRHALLVDAVRQEAATQGFAADAFAPYFELLQKSYAPQSADYFKPLTTTTLAPLLCQTDGHHLVTRTLSVPRAQADTLCERINSTGGENSFAFHIRSLNATLARHLSADFTYIGWACGLIVFLFLWASFRRFEMAAFAFLPMAVSWLWILGTMHLLDLRFNLVNIILATFIFGQGDDYSIFMTEGLLYERTYRRPMLAAYKRGILLSALIMFVGMGVLILAQHPALRSLGAITIVGMGCVVGVTYVLPPFVFRWLTQADAPSPWTPPITLGNVLHTLRLWGALWTWVLRTRCSSATDSETARIRLSTLLKKRLVLRYSFSTEVPLPPDAPVLWALRPQSPLDALIFTAGVRRAVVVAPPRSPLLHSWVGRLLRASGRLHVLPADAHDLAQRIEAERQMGSAFLLDLPTLTTTPEAMVAMAAEWRLALHPVAVVGTLQLLPFGAVYARRGQAAVAYGAPFSPTALNAQSQLEEHLDSLRQTALTAADFTSAVCQTYAYRESGLEAQARRELRLWPSLAERLHHTAVDAPIVLTEVGTGACALQTALVFPNRCLYVLPTDTEQHALLAALLPLCPTLVLLSPPPAETASTSEAEPVSLPPQARLISCKAD